MLEILVEEESFIIEGERITVEGKKVRLIVLCLQKVIYDLKILFEIYTQLTMEEILNMPNGIQFSGPPPTATRRRRQVQSLPPPSMNISTTILEDAFMNTNVSGVIFTYYSNSSLFPLNLTNRTIATPVIGATFSDESENFDLVENVTLTFHLSIPVCRLIFVSNHF